MVEELAFRARRDLHPASNWSYYEGACSSASGNKYKGSRYDSNERGKDVSPATRRHIRVGPFLWPAAATTVHIASVISTIMLRRPINCSVSSTRIRHLTQPLSRFQLIRNLAENGFLGAERAALMLYRGSGC